MKHTLDPRKRAAEKAAARARDEADLAASRVTPQELSRRNGFLSALDLSKFRIESIGRNTLKLVPKDKRRVAGNRSK